MPKKKTKPPEGKVFISLDTAESAIRDQVDGHLEAEGDILRMYKQFVDDDATLVTVNDEPMLEVDDDGTHDDDDE